MAGSGPAIAASARVTAIMEPARHFDLDEMSALARRQLGLLQLTRALISTRRRVPKRGRLEAHVRPQRRGSEGWPNRKSL